MDKNITDSLPLEDFSQLDLQQQPYPPLQVGVQPGTVVAGIDNSVGNVNVAETFVNANVFLQPQGVQVGDMFIPPQVPYNNVIDQAATYVDQQTNAEAQQQDSPQDAAVPKKKARKLAVHEDHKSLCKALCIDPKDRVTIGILRAYVKKSCEVLNCPITKNYSEYAKEELTALITNLVIKWNADRSTFSNSAIGVMNYTLMDAIFHRLCLDYVRTNRNRRNNKKPRDPEDASSTKNAKRIKLSIASEPGDSDKPQMEIAAQHYPIGIQPGNFDGSHSDETIEEIHGICVSLNIELNREWSLSNLHILATQLSNDWEIILPRGDRELSIGEVFSALIFIVNSVNGTIKY
ncbi:hypothetical protein FN846DRAFT_1013061 [Sphaerosporella brunnea]|uniref:Uncharacterized protein n=1 Tax=Sphaerosporella brunnea TaxID=1250544 RepID=A0A5J5EXP7_9PEZI|nr:hypothetical protein FN846DRAFT_1013061 [Sphaerosporella brunnea]